MNSFFNRLGDRLRERIARERKLDRPIGAFSRVLWPFPESKLVFYVCILAVLDYASTFTALELSGNNQISEIGLMAKWALQTGGFPKLLLVDAASIGILICLAIGARFLYSKLGFNGFGRAAFVFLLIPYFLFIWAAVVNNVLLAFL